MMNERDIERAAGEVLAILGMEAPPVEPFEIARQEGIALLPGEYDGCFDSRIEYRRMAKSGRFWLFYAKEAPPDRPPGRVRFSIAHELGHYYLHHHRQALMSGQSHSSQSGFVSAREVEQEADLFAAALLMPDSRFTAEVRKKSQGICSLDELVLMADTVFETSVTSTVRRSTQLNFEPCAMIISRGGQVIYCVSSEDLREMGMGWIRTATPVPSSSITGELLKTRESTGKTEGKGRVYPDVWFNARDRRPLWEEALILGRTGLVLTFIVVDED